MQLHVLQFQAIDSPEHLIGIVDNYILQFYIVHLTEELGTVDDTVLHLQVVGIPNGRT